MRKTLCIVTLAVFAALPGGGCSSPPEPCDDCADGGTPPDRADGGAEPDAGADPETDAGATPDSLAHWRFDEASGEQALDDSGRGHHGTLHHGVARVGGKAGQALRFDGTDDYVEVPTSASLNPYPLSVSLWFRTSSSDGLQGLLNKYRAASQNGFQLFLVNGDLCAWYMRDATNHVYDNSGTCTLRTPGLADGAWHHVAFVVDASGGRLFVDGTPRGVQPWSGQPGAPTTSQLLRFGHYPGAAGDAAFFEGELDEVQLWDRVLTSEELATLSGKSPDTTPPAITAVSAAPTSNGAVVTWTTDEPSSSQVEYGLTSSLGTATTAVVERVTSHRIVLTGLQPGTTYHFRVRSADAAGNSAASEPGTFRTATDAVFPGGFVELSTTTPNRTPPSTATLQALLPRRGAFTFPAPYGTTGIRITNETDCGGAGNDCVHYVGYSYWANMNNHVGSDTMYILLGLNTARGGSGPTLFSYDKRTDEVKNLGPLFTGARAAMSGEGFYFSGTQPTALYIRDAQGPKLYRFDVLTKTLTTVFDATDHAGPGHYIWQAHSSQDDQVHSATLRRNSGATLGCLVYFEPTKTFRLFAPVRNDFDECQIDKSGRWLLMKEQVDGADGEDNRIIDLQNNNAEKRLLDRDGAAGHSDNGHGYMVAADNWANQANTLRLWRFGSSPLDGTVVYRNQSWSSVGGGPNHIAHGNARADVPIEQQYACGSNATSGTSAARDNEIVCFRLDGSLRTLVVAPVMTSMSASGGGSDSYSKLPKGNVDVTGRYFIWTSNVGGNRLDAFLVKIPAQKLYE